METTWVVIADQTRARIFAMPRPRAALEELDDLVNPEGRLHDQDLNSDRPGRAFDSKGLGRHAMGKHHSPKEQEAIRFAHAIGEHLAEGLQRGDFGQLVVSAPPRFLGLLREALPEGVVNRIVLDLDKDLVGLSAGDVGAYLSARLPEVMPIPGR
ncbi:host attachment protein [Halomonas sp. C05BenzN]|uniref:host attachment protein n=1 Tax=Halomonas sp. C05BenzN TaxID=3411041 RepID=UPI003B947A85